MKEQVYIGKAHGNIINYFKVATFVSSHKQKSILHHVKSMSVISVATTPPL